MLLPILILSILFNKGILPAKIYYILIAIIAIIGGIFIWKTIFSIVLRDPMNYEEYNWYFNPANAPTSTTADTTDPWASKTASSNFGSCIGDACCSDGLVYDSSSNQCVISTTTNTDTTDTTIETFVNNIFTKPSNNYKKPDVILGGDNIQSNNSESFINYKKF